ncbi:unnamed protein product [Discula destructiva]
MDGIRSTTPPISPQESSETLQQQHQQSQQPEQPEQSQPPSFQEEIMVIDDNDQESQPESAPPSKLPRPARGKTPEPNRVIQISHHTNGHASGHSHAAAVAHAPHLSREHTATPGSPGAHLNSFDWDDLEKRFERALADATEHEQALLAEFGDLVKYFNVWASTASAHDDERAAKRLQTRTHYVQIKETDLASKRQHYESVVQAFQNAMMLLGQMQG